jgi:small-conductance mechanosensitive channel
MGATHAGGDGEMDAVYGKLVELLSQAVDFVPRLILAIVVFLASLLGAKFAGRAVARAAKNADEEVSRLLSRLAAVATIVVGSVVALDQVNFDVTGFVAGLGLVGFTLGFAFQDIAKNLMAGILIVIQQPFEIGEAIEVSGYSGAVTDVDIRATTIKAWDGQKVIIPNADVYTSTIVNYSESSSRWDWDTRRTLGGLRRSFWRRFGGSRGSWTTPRRRSTVRVWAAAPWRWRPTSGWTRRSRACLW